jgi:hypothetical protein
MKTKVLFIAFMATVSLFSCKKSGDILPDSHNGPGNYRAGFVSKAGDTTWTATRAARTETVGLDSAQDSKIKAVLVSYNGKGVFTVTATNLTSCQGIIRWNWDGNFKIDSIGYASGNPNDPSNDVLKAGQTKTFVLYTQPKPGRLKIKLMNNTGNCGNSSELIINITTTILPITYTDFSVSYTDNRVFIGFNITEPSELNWVVIQRLDGKEYKTVLLVPGDDKTKSYNIKLP